MNNEKQGFITILTGLYSFQDCIHFLASVRKFHQEPIVILIDQVPKYLQFLLLAFLYLTKIANLLISQKLKE